jgi:hypothetical protein
MRPLSMLMAVALTGCATRSLPQTFTVGSPASAAAPAAPAADVTGALRTDPPLPGDDAKDWAGLEPLRDEKGATSANHESRQGHGHAH